ncbi:MAG TPA: PAS domain S-box protein [Thermoanaerobaculia bacterium]|nr:PAS domain S-box protein [Thermoanaerobaculia bacterium]
MRIEAKDSSRSTPALEEVAQEIPDVCSPDEPRAADHWALLAELSRLLSASLDYRQTLDSLARFMVPTLADYCILDTFDEAGHIGRAAVIHKDPALRELAEELCRCYPPRLGARTGMGLVLRTGQAILAPEVNPAAIRDAALDERHLWILERFGPRSTIIVPLIARGRILGALSLSFTTEGRRYTPSDLAFAEELAYRAALAIDNVRLYEQAQRARAEAQEAARRQEESAALLDALLVSAPVGLSFLDRDLRYLRMNDVMARITGVDPTAVLGRSVREVIPDLAPQTEPLYRRVLETGEPLIGLEVSGETPASPGAKRHFLANYYPISPREGPPLGVGAAVVEITERKRAEVALREINQTLQALIRACPLAIMVLDPEDGSVHLWNPAAESIFGWTEAEVLGHPLQTVPDDLQQELRRSLQNIVAGRMPQGVETRWQRKDGTSIDVSLWTAALPDAQGTPRVMALVADIRDRRQLERELERRLEELAEADRRKDEFLAMLAHELRNPLAAISNAGLVLGERRGEDSRSAELLGVIGRQIRHLSRLVDDLLDVSRFTHGRIVLRKAAVELAPVVAGAVETARPLLEARGHSFSVSLPDEPLWLEADATRMEQVLANLLNNAAKFTEPGGQVGLSVEREGDDVLLRVRDTGVGIPPDLLPRIFDLFVQGERSLDRAHGGLGIGLTLVRSLVERHGGTVAAASEGPGRGSEITVRLPLLPDAARDAPAAAAVPPEKRRETVRVLLVEDNEDAAAALAELLRIWGHRVAVVHDGPSALQAARAEQPDVVLLDIGLPGMDGYEVARAFRELPGLEEVTLVALTGYGQDSDRLRSSLAGIDHHLVKPVDPDQLRRLIAGIV